MDLTTIVRILGAILFVVALTIIVMRRKRMASRRRKVG
jgi:hypothetical protein